MAEEDRSQKDDAVGMLEYIGKTADIDESTVGRAYKGDFEGLKAIFNVVSREASSITLSAFALAAAASGTAYLAYSGKPVQAVIMGGCAILFGAKYHQATLGLNTARQTILNRLPPQR